MGNDGPAAKETTGTRAQIFETKKVFEEGRRRSMTGSRSDGHVVGSYLTGAFFTRSVTDVMRLNVSAP